MKLKTVVAALAFLIVSHSSNAQTAPRGNQSSLKLEVYTSSPRGYSVTSTIVSGPNAVMVIDPQFLLSEARQVIARIRATGKPLTLIYSTHAHPDHMFGVAALKEAFPNARYVATPEAIERAKTGWPARRNFWVMEYGEADLPSATAILAEPLPANNTLVFEGETLTVTKEVMGADGAGNSFVHIPSLNAVVAGDIVFHNSHFGIPADMAGWNATIARIEALNPRILVAGHQTQSTNNEPKEAISFMRTYIAEIAAMKASSTSAMDYEKKILAKFPNLALADRTLPRTLTAAFPAPPAPQK